MKNVILFGLILLLLGCSSIFVNQTKLPQNKHAKLDYINELIRTHQYKDAKKALEKFIHNNPSNMSAYNKLFFLYNVAEVSPDEIAKDQENYTAILYDIFMPDSLSMQVEYLFMATLEDSAASSKLDTMIHKYPNCIVSTENAQEEIFNYAVMRDDSVRAQGLEEFLEIYPDNKWTPLAWRYLLYSYDNLGNVTKLDSTLRVVELKYPHDPRMINTAARYYLDKKQKLSDYEEKMSVMIDSLDNAAWDKEFYFFGDKSREEQLATYRFTLAELYYEQEKYDDALTIINEIPDDQLLAQHYYLMGKIEMKLEQDADAFSHLLQAVIIGDERNSWTPKADSSCMNYIMNCPMEGRLSGSL